MRTSSRGLFAQQSDLSDILGRQWTELDRIPTRTPYHVWRPGFLQLGVLRTVRAKLHLAAWAGTSPAVARRATTTAALEQALITRFGTPARVPVHVPAGSDNGPFFASRTLGWCAVGSSRTHCSRRHGRACHPFVEGAVHPPHRFGSRQHATRVGRRPAPVLQPPAARPGAGHDRIGPRRMFSGLTCAGTAGSLQGMPESSDNDIAEPDIVDRKLIIRLPFFFRSRLTPAK